MRGIDGNIIVYALNKDLPEYYDCNSLLKLVAKGEEIISIPAIVLMECYHALVYSYKFTPSDVKRRLLSIINSKNISILPIMNSTIIIAFEISETYKMGGRDSLIVASLLEYNIKEIYSHDKDFDKIKLIKRIDPVKKMI
jgi:predicted nucleic acid-binding protein